MADWSNLQEELLNMIAVRLFSAVELKRFRSICRSWRSSVPGVDNNNPFRMRPLIHFNPIAPSDVLLYGEVYRCDPGAFLSRAAFFRVSHSSSSKGWMIKSDMDTINSGKFRLLQPLSRRPWRVSSESLDLLEFTVSGIRETYAVLDHAKGSITVFGFQRSALVKVKKGEDLHHHHGVLGIGLDGYITYWNGNVLTRLEQMGYRFSDIVVHKGVTYVLDSQGIVWCISSDLEIFRYGTSVDENITDGCFGDMRFVESCRELYIVERLPKENTRERKTKKRLYNSRTVGFKVYKMVEELAKWIEVKSLGDNAFVMASDTCFSVLAHEFYGCLKNSIYFTANEDSLLKVFKLDNGNGSRIIEFSSSNSSKGPFQMFYP